MRRRAVEPLLASRTARDRVKNSSPRISTADAAPAAGCAVRGRPDVTIEVIRGRTHTLCRRALTTEFRVGAAIDCHLRLGGTGIPAVHCVLTRTAGRAQLRAVAAHPPLIVNGRVEEQMVLHDGDLVEIGCFAFVIHIDPGQPRTSSDDQPGRDGMEHTDGRDVSELTAAELIDLIEQEEQAVEAFDKGLLRGADALLKALVEHLEEEDFPPILTIIPLNQTGLPNRYPALDGGGTADVATGAVHVHDGQELAAIAHQIQEICRRLEISGAGSPEISDARLRLESLLTRLKTLGDGACATRAA